MLRENDRLSELLAWPGLVLLGLAVGAYGTMIGAGGGFVLVPMLLVIYPGKPPETITSISTPLRRVASVGSSSPPAPSGGTM